MKRHDAFHIIVCVLLIATTLVVSQTSQKLPPGVPSDPVAAGCTSQPNMDSLGVIGLAYTCPAPNDMNDFAKEFSQIEEMTAFQRIGGFRVTILNDYPRGEYTPPEIVFSLPDGTLGSSVFVDLTDFRSNYTLRTSITSRVDLVNKNIIIPLFYNRLDKRWEPMEFCSLTVDTRAVKCTLYNWNFRRYSGMQLLTVNTVCNDKVALRNLMQTATVENPNRKICVPSFDQLSRLCPAVVYAEALPYGSNSLREAMVKCTHPLCFLFPANLATYTEGACVYGFNKRCGVIDPETGKEVCCGFTLAETGGEARGMWDMLGGWSRYDNNDAPRRATMGVYKNFGYMIRPNTFLSSQPSSVAILDESNAPGDMPIPHKVFSVGSIVNIVFEQVPSKPFDVFIKSNFAGYNDCGQAQIVQSTAMSFFYYDTPTRRWVSIPIEGDSATTGNFSYDIQKGVGTATIPPRVAIRNNLSVFLAMLTGIPILPNNEHLRATFLLPPIGLRKEDVYKQGWGLETLAVGCNFLMPVKAGSQELEALEVQNAVVVGSPGTAALGEMPGDSYTVSMFVDPSILLDRTSTPPVNPSSRSTNRRIMRFQDVPHQIFKVLSGLASFSQRRLLQVQEIPVDIGVSLHFLTNGTWARLPNCTFNTTTTTVECRLQPWFFQRYGLKLTVANLANSSSTVSINLKADQDRATWVETLNTSAMQAFFDSLLSESRGKFGINETVDFKTLNKNNTPPPTSSPPPAKKEEDSSVVVFVAILLTLLFLIVLGVVVYCFLTHICCFAYTGWTSKNYIVQNNMVSRMDFQMPQGPPPVNRLARFSSNGAYTPVPVLEADIDSFLGVNQQQGGLSHYHNP